LDTAVRSDEKITMKPRSSLFGFIYEVIRSMFWAIVIGFIINCILWHREGYEKLMIALNKNYNTEMTGIYLRNHQFADLYQSQIHTLSNFTSEIDEQISESIHFKSIMNAYTIDLWNLVQGYSYKILQVFNETAKDIMAKTLSVMVSLWIFIFSSLLGAMDGLLHRYIRTQEGGRESTYVYHKVAYCVYKAPLAIILLYLALPIMINPEIVVVILSMTFFMFFYLTTASLKKYL
jgi:hypothetical protein